MEAQANSTIEGIVVLDLEGNKILQNRQTIDLFKIPREVAEDDYYESLFHWIVSQVKTPSACIEKFSYLRSHPNAISRDEVELKSGTILDRYSAPVLDEEGHCYGRIWTFRDVTERKRSEIKAQEALRQEMILRRELHHRVKNNLQVIISLLFLQSTTVTDPVTQSLLRESQGRVRSIALIHEMLYQRDDLTQISFGDYARQLGADLFHTYRVTQEEIRLEVDSPGVCLGINAAIPCGIIINELITNALKYAFPEGRKGVIEIALKSGPASNRFTLCVRDNGIGLPKEFDLERTKTMGISLVRDLARQLGGSLEVATALDGGTQARLTFDEPAVNGRA